MQKTTLKEQGAKLPVPYEKLGDKLDFEFKPWKLKEEKEIGKLRKKQRHTSKFIREVFEYMLSNFGGQEWDSMDKREKKVLLNQMPYSNILYMYIWLRYEALGEEVKFTGFQCPSCGHEVKDFVGDLESLEIEIPEEDDKKKLYELKKPFRMGDVQVEGVYTVFTPWDVMETVTPGTSDAGTVKETFIRRSVVKVKTDLQDEADLNVVQLIENLTKRDIEGLYEHISESNGGPNMGIELDCPACEYHMVKPLDWDFEVFFGSSSL